MRGRFLVTGCCLLALLTVACKEEKGQTDRAPQPQTEATSAPVKTAAANSITAVATPAPPVAKPTATASSEAAQKEFQNIDLPDSVRLAAARQLLDLNDDGRDFLAENYAIRNNEFILRALIEEKTAAGDEDVLPLLVQLFERVGGEERIDIEQYLLHFGRRSENHLMVFLHSEDASLVLRTLDTLSKINSTAAADSIAPLLEHADSWIRLGAAHALGEIGAPGAAEQLVAALDDTVHSVVNAALVGLGRLRARGAYDAIHRLTASDNPHIRKHSAIALGELGDDRALSTVRALAEEDPDSGVRFMAAKALKKLAGPP